MLYLTGPLWVVEIVPPKGRSILAGIIGLFGVLGYILAAYVGVGFFYNERAGSAQWRAPLALGCFPPVIFLCLCPWLPESPRWLLAQDRNKEAWDIIQTLHTSKDDPGHNYATAEFYQMTKQHELEANLASSWVEIFRRPSFQKRTAIVFMLPIIIYFTGIPVITNQPTRLTIVDSS